MARQPTDLEVGFIGKPHGLRGDVMVRLTTDRLERVTPGAELRTETVDLVVRTSRAHQSGYIVGFEGIDHRDAAENLRGCALFAEPIDDPDVVWVHELIGASIEEVDGTPRGTIVAVQENPASDLLVTDDGALVPLTFYVERRDDLVVVDTPAGLFDDQD